MTDLLTSLFDTLSLLWEMSLTAAYAAIVVALLRLVLKKRAPRQVLCLLWLVVFARLLVPVSLESPLSIVPDAEQVQLAQNLPSMLTGGGQTASGLSPAQEPVQNAVQAQPGGVTAEPISQGSANVPHDPALAVPNGVSPAAPERPAPAAFLWQAVIAGVWLVGVLAMGGCGLISCLRLKSRLYDAIRAEDGAWEHPSVDSPFILGMVRPRIYLPAGLYGQPRRFILCHERAHLHRLDHVVKPVCWAALALHWFNPFVWMAFLLMSRDIEAACDEAVIRQLGPRVKADYSATLLALATNGRIPAPCPLAFDEGDAKGRIQNVLRYRRPALWIVVVSAIAAVLVAVCLLTDPVSAKAPDDPDPDPSASQNPVQTPDQGLNALLDPWMLEVLNGERQFYNGNEAFNIHQLRTMVYGDEELPRLTLEVGRLAIIDLDRDGINEMVVWPETETGSDFLHTVGYMVFRRRGDDVFCYAPLGWRPMQNLKADGTFNWSGSAGYWGIGSKRFNDGVIETDAITWCDNLDVDDENYFVNGVATTKEEFEAAWAAHQAKPGPTWYVFEDGVLNYASTGAANLPDSYDLGLSVPDFLDDEQLTAYYQTYAVYSRLFGVSAEGVDPDGYGSSAAVEYNGTYYLPFTNEYADWNTFDALVKSVFTDSFWAARSGGSLYVNIDGVTHYMDWGRGGGGYNENFPETFRLVEKTDDSVSFIMTGYYSSVRRFMDATMDADNEHLEAWLAAGWEYSIDFPMRMVRTQDGWRFDQFCNARTDNGIAPFYDQEVPNPNAPALPDPLAYGPDDEACLHGFGHVYVSTLDGTDYSTKIHQAQDTSMIFRCLEDGFTYIVPAPITGRDYWFGRGAEDDFDGDGRIEEAILQEGGRLIMVCDVEGGRLRTCTVETGSLIDAFNQSLSYSWTDDGETMALDLTYEGQRIQARFTGLERELIVSYGEENVPYAADWNGFLYSGEDILLSLPIYLTGCGEDSNVLLGAAEWTFRYSGGEIVYAPDSFQLVTGPDVPWVDLPVSWTA